MNPDKNMFEQLMTALDKDKLVRPDGSDVPKHWSIFSVGENYVINNYTFRCAYIGETSILFEPVGPLLINK